jgi:hypothetical protein
MMRFNVGILYTDQVSCLSIRVWEVLEEPAASIFVAQKYAFEYTRHEDPNRWLMMFTVGS